MAFCRRAFRHLFLLAVGVVAGTILPGPAWGQKAAAVQELTMSDSVDLAMENNMDLAASRRMLDAAQGDLTSASIFFPSNPEFELDVARRNSPENDTTDFEARLVQEFQIAGQRGKRVAVAENNLEIIRQQILDATRRLRAGTRERFIGTIYALEVLELQSKAEELMKSFLDATAERYDAGAARQMELNLARIEYGKARSEVLKSRRNYRRALAELRQVLGRPQEEEIIPEGALDYLPRTVKLSDLVLRALETRPDLQVLHLKRKAAELSEKLFMADRIPNLSLFGFFERDEGDDIAGGGLSVSLPLWRRNQGLIQRAKGEQAVSSARIRARELEIAKEVYAAYESYLAADRSVKVFEEEVIAQVEDNLQLNEESYREGKIDYIEFLLVQRSLIETKLAYLDSLSAYHKSLSELERESGVAFLP